MPKGTRVVVHFRCATCDDEATIRTKLPDDVDAWHIDTRAAMCDRCSHIRTVITRQADELTQRWAHSLAEFNKTQSLTELANALLAEVNAAREEHTLPPLAWEDV